MNAMDLVMQSYCARRLSGNNTMQTNKLKLSCCSTAQLAGDPEYTIVQPDGASIPVIPVFPNPGRFTLDDAWGDKERAIKKLLHEQEADAFLLASNVDKALIVNIKEIFNESIWADLNKGTTIGSSSLCNRHTVRQIQNHLETKFNKH
jgi:hypothetical protein